MFGKGAKYDVKKLRGDDYIKALKETYVTFDKCLRQLIAWLDETALIKCDRFLPSKSALIPLVDYMLISGRHEKPDGRNSEAMKQYLHMAFFTRLFGRSGDATLDKIHKQLVLSIKGDPDAGVLPEGNEFPLDHMVRIIKERTKADYGLQEHFFWADADLVLNIVQGGVLQIDPTNPTKHPKDLRLEVDHIFPRSKVQKSGNGDIANHVGNYRLVVLPVNRRKLARWPDANTDFTGKNDPGIQTAYDRALAKFERATYLDFISTRENLIKKRVEEFMGLKLVGGERPAP